jgi:hypothetical protein
MDWLPVHLDRAGWTVWPVLAVGMLGGVSFIAVIVAMWVRSRHVRLLAWISVALAALCSGLGVLGAELARQHVDNAVSGPALSRVQQLEIRRTGYRDARSAVVLALALSGLPLVAGAIGSLASRGERTSRRRSRASATAPGEKDSPKSARSGTSLGQALRIVAGGAALMSIGGALATMLSPLPGPDLDIGDPAWRLLDAVDRVESGDLKGGCARLEESPPRSHGGGQQQSVSEPVPGYSSAEAACIDYRLQQVRQLPRDMQLARLRALRGGGGFGQPNDKQLQRIDAEIARLERERAASSSGDREHGASRPRDLAHRRRPSITTGEVDSFELARHEFEEPAAIGDLAFVGASCVHLARPRADDSGAKGPPAPPSYARSQGGAHRTLGHGIRPTPEWGH